MGKCRSRAMMVFTMLFALGVYADESSNISSGEVIDNTPAPINLVPTENPHSKAPGQRIAGGVLCGVGGVSLLFGIICKTQKIYENMYEDMGTDMGETGAMLDNIMWIEGAITLGVGVALEIVGQAKYGQWKKWEKEHGVHAYLQGNKLVVDF